MEASMETLHQTLSDAAELTLSERVDQLIHPHDRRPLLSTTGTRVAISQLAARTQVLEQAIREIALEVQSLAASH
jgi:hypothetical protein